MSLAICVISHDKRIDKLERIYADILAQRPDEVLIVADTSPPPWYHPPHWYPSLPPEEHPRPHYSKPGWVSVVPVTQTTVDALIKRDVGWMATRSDYICYLADDHTLGRGFVETFRADYEYAGSARGGRWDILCPQRFCMDGELRRPLNVGQAEGYVSGHAGIYGRAVNRAMPWMSGSHHRNWDLIQTHAQVAAGFVLRYATQDLFVEDLEPEAKPWL